MAESTAFYFQLRNSLKELELQNKQMAEKLIQAREVKMLTQKNIALSIQIEQNLLRIAQIYGAK